MAILSSQIVRNHDRGNGYLSVHEEHTDDLGIVHEHRYHCPVGHDVDLALTNWVAILEAILVRREKTIVFTTVSEGADPTLFVRKYLTVLQFAKQVLKALMFGRAEKVVKAALYISGFTDAQIENYYPVAIRIRIRARQNYVLDNQVIIETDATQREEI